MTKSTTVILILCGMVSILAGKITPASLPILAMFLETLGVTVVSVLVVKLIYEKYIAEEHFKKFLELLKAQLSAFQNVAGTSLLLGIREVFPTRTVYEETYGVTNIISTAPSGTNVLCIGNSLFHFTNHTNVIYNGLKKGLNIDLCLLDPNHHTRKIEEVLFIYLDDITAAIRNINVLVSKS